MTVLVGGVIGQLVALLDAARAERNASVIVASEPFVIELGFAHNRVVGHAGRDASKVSETALTPEDAIILQILGWQQRDARDDFVRMWHEDTPSSDIADDIVRAVTNAYRRDESDIEVRLSLQPQLDVAAR
jgi:hypothetical protein